MIAAVALINFARSCPTIASYGAGDGEPRLRAGQSRGARHWAVTHPRDVSALVGPLTVLASLSIGTAILEVAGLSFLGLGGDMTAAEWGAMLSQAKDYWSRNLWYALARLWRFRFRCWGSIAWAMVFAMRWIRGWNP